MSPEWGRRIRDSYLVTNGRRDAHNELFPNLRMATCDYTHVAGIAPRLQRVVIVRAVSSGEAMFELICTWAGLKLIVRRRRLPGGQK